jgi:hypothetical protein
MKAMMQDNPTCEYVTLVLTAGYDCGANHYWVVEQINDRLILASPEDYKDNYGELLNPFGCAGWEVVHVTPFLSADAYDMKRTVQLRRTPGDGTKWEYTVVFVEAEWAETEMNSGDFIVPDTRLLSAIPPSLSEQGWEMVWAMVYPWSEGTIEYVFKRRQMA